ncbi:MAG: globin domain-containing protein [Pseudomonadota bacterium]
MKLSDDDVDLIRASYVRISHDLPHAGEVFYAQLFQIDPALEVLFVADVDKQAGKLMSTLGLVVSQLQNWQDLEPVVEDLAMRHLAYGVHAEHYEAVGKALHAMFEEILDRDYAPSMRAAWDRAYRALSDAMIDTAYRARDTSF